MNLVWARRARSPNRQIEQVVTKTLDQMPPQGTYIALGELEVHLDREEPLQFRTASQNHIAVELLPGVPAYMKWPITTEPAAAQSRGVSGSARQGEFPLRTSYDEPGYAGFAAERQSAISDLERAVDRINNC